jgi:hypothetical protein
LQFIGRNLDRKGWFGKYVAKLLWVSPS